MNKLNKVILTLSATALVAVPVGGIIVNPNVAHAISVEQTQGQAMAALGGSLSSAQAQQTLQLLGAANVQQSNIMYVDGSVINQYLQDGSNASTVVYSSAYIQEMPEGYGVQVQIVTPQNILNVSQLTYQNAAITAGARNAQIRVATVSPVTGEGALAGVYALLSKSGVQVNQKDVQVAQKEITLVNEIQQETGLNNAQVNQAIADVKTEITNTIVNSNETNTNIENNGDGDINNVNETNTDNSINNSVETNTDNSVNIDNSTTINEETINNIVINIIEQNDINVDENPEIVTQLTDYAREYAGTEAAKNVETVQQLEQSTTPVWADVLAELDSSITVDQLASREPVTFDEQAEIKPEIKALADSFNNNMANGGNSVVDYSYSFAYETFNPELSLEDKAALNDIRTEMFAYAMAQENEQASQTGMTAMLKERWINNASNFENLKVAQPVLAEIFTQVGVQIGMMPQVYSYQVTGQEGTVISLEVTEDLIDHVNTYRYTYDLATGQVMDVYMDEPTPHVPVDYTGAFGTNLVDNRTDKVEIPVDYVVPQEYIVPSELESTEESSEETSEESSESSEEITEMEEVTEELEEFSVDITEAIEEVSEETTIVE